MSRLLQPDLPARAGAVRRTAARSSVDLPAPFGPTIATISPASTRRSIRRRAASRRRPHRDRLRFEHGGHRPHQPALAQQQRRGRTARRSTAVRMPIGSSAGATMVRASVSAPTSSTRAEQHRGRQQQAVAGPDHQPQQMRHDDADEADHAGDRDRGARHRRHQHDRDPLQPLDLDAACERPRPRPAPADRARAR